MGGHLQLQPLISSYLAALENTVRHFFLFFLKAGPTFSLVQDIIVLQWPNDSIIVCGWMLEVLNWPGGFISPVL